MLWLGVHFPDLGLEIFATEQTAASQRPQVLAEDNRVLLRNAAAVAAGIAPGASLATAHSIAPELVHHHRDTGREQARLQFLAETLYRFTSQISLKPPDCLLLEISGSLRLFGDRAALSSQVQALCEALEHRARLHVAETPLAALLLACSQAHTIDDVSLQHIQWHLSKPSAKSGKQSRNKSVRITERLADMGIHTLGPLLALPQKELGHRFGPELVGFLQRLSGERPDPQENILPSESFASCLHLLNPINSKDALLFPMARLLGELQLWLIGRQLGAEKIRWHLQSGSRQEANFPVALARGQQRREAFLNLTRLKLEQTELPADILSLELQVTALVPWQAQGPELLGLSPQDNGRTNADLSELVDQLRARLGDGACYSIRPVAQHAPEQAWRQVQPGDSLASGHGATSNASAISAKRPLWFFDPPRPAARQELTLLRGPERIQGVWWQQSICRDYYIARHKNGAECWAYVDAQQQWYLHGYFA